MIKNNISAYNTLNTLHLKEKQFKKELSKIFLDYLDSLSPDKRIEQMELLLSEPIHRKPALNRRLTPQENKCLYLASKGKEIKETARILGLSQRTIKFHRVNITKKLEVPNLMAAIASSLPSKNEDELLLTEILKLIPASIGSQKKYGFSLKNFDDFKRTESLINLLPGNVFIVNSGGYLLWGNQRVLDTLQLKSLNEYIGKHIGYWDNYSWECCQDIIESRKEKVVEETYQGRYYMTNRKPIFSSHGQIVAIIGTSLDITEQKKMK